MPRKSNALPGPSRLSGILKDLTRDPKLSLSSNLRSLKLTLAARNDHFGARHFVKEELPRIRYVNPELEIEVKKVAKTREDSWTPELSLQYADGRSQTLDLTSKWSTTIVRELMDTAGTSSWLSWKENAQSKGLPLVPGEEFEGVGRPRVPTVGVKANAFRKPLRKRAGVDGGKAQREVGEGEKLGEIQQLLDVLETTVPPEPRTGPGAVLP